MFPKKLPNRHRNTSTNHAEVKASAATVIGVGCEIYGNLSLSTPLQIDGKIEGDIVSTDAGLLPARRYRRPSGRKRRQAQVLRP